MTHTAKHTPGPWKAVPDRSRNLYTWYVEGAKGVVPAIARLSLIDACEEIEGNAHLIAAAPAMYEALRRIKVLMESGDIEGKDWMEYGQIVQALAQAEGKQS